MKTVTERFLTYVKHHTTSDETSDTFPSTKRQLAFAAFLAKECEAIGLQSVSMDDRTSARQYSKRSHHRLYFPHGYQPRCKR